MAAHRANPGIFSPGGLLGSREYVYDLSESDEGQRAKAKIVARHGGYKIYKTPDKEFYSSLDPDSWYESLAAVKRSIDDYKRGRNPKSEEQFDVEYYSIPTDKWFPSRKGRTRKAAERHVESLVHHGFKRDLVRIVPAESNPVLKEFHVEGPNGREYFSSIDQATGKTAERRDIHGGRSLFYPKRTANPDPQLIRQAESERSAEALGRLYQYAERERYPALKSAVERRARELRIPHGELTRRDQYSPFRNPGSFKIIESYYDQPSNKTHARAETAGGTDWYQVSGRVSRKELPGLLKFNDGYKRSKKDRELGRNPRRRNPADSEAEADAMYESFHGRPADRTIEVHEDIEEAMHVSQLGPLTELYVDTLTGYRYHVSFAGKDAPQLTANSEGTSLEIKGGNQRLDLAKIKMDGSEWVKPKMVIGEFSPPDPCSKCGGEFKYSRSRNVHVCQSCRHVADDHDRVHNLTYQTEKDFDKFRKIDYHHALGEESGVRPTLVYDPENELLFVTGGQYRIERPLLETSRGIEN